MPTIVMTNEDGASISYCPCLLGLPLVRRRGAQPVLHDVRDSATVASAGEVFALARA
jgi:hypothetical protein